MQLMKIELCGINGEEQQTCNARDLWVFLESKQQFADWIKSRIERYGFVEGQDYTIHKIMNNPETGGRPVIEYRLTLDMGKEIAMVEGNPKGQQVRRHFLDCEKFAKQRPVDHLAALRDPVLLHQLLLENVEAGWSPRQRSRS